MLDRLIAEVPWLLAQALPDTIYTRTIAEDPSTFEKITSVASGLTSILILILAAALVPAAWNLRKTHSRLNKLLDRVQDDMMPLVKHASAIADDVHYITTSLRTDVQQVSNTVNSANRRMQKAMLATEAKVREFNALLEVVQEEAEDIFVRSASTARGVRIGVESFGAGAMDVPERGEPMPPPDTDSGEEDAEDAIDRYSDLSPTRPRVRRRQGY
jgi:hypothetical protein